MPEDNCRTSDAALAAYLKTIGSHPVQILWQAGTCYWFFLKTPEVVKAVDDFTSGHALVEPVLYNRYFGETKRELYDRRALTDAS